MSDNSSSSNLPLDQLIACFRSEVSLILFSAMVIANILLLPVFVLVFYLGYRQRRQQAGPSNLFTYHAVAMQLNTFLGLILLFYGADNTLFEFFLVALSFLSVTSAGQSLFHILICVEHYLAVIHPVTYLHLKQAGEAKIRHVCAGCVWLLSCGWLLVYILGSTQLNFILYCFAAVFSLTVICFCSVSVLYALKRTGPGEGGGNRAQADQSKRRAFYTILTILGVLLFGFVGNVSLFSSVFISSANSCVPYLSTIWLNLPSNLVQPVLFLHRARKLKYCKEKTGRTLATKAAACVQNGLRP